MAADSTAIRAGRAFVEIFTDDVQFKKALERTSRQFKAWGEALTAAGTKLVGVGALIAAPLVAATKIFVDMGDELAKASTRTGIAVESLSKLKYAADQSGSSLEGLEAGLKKMAKLVAEASVGSKEAAGKIEALGINVSELAKQTPEEQLKTFADAIARTTDPTQRAAIAMEIFGKQGTRLIPLLAEGSKGLEKLYAEAERLGLVISTEDAKAAEEFHERLNDLWSVMRATAFTVGGALAPALRLAAITITEGVNTVRRFINAHRELVLVVGLVAAGLILAGGTLVGLGLAFSIAGTAIGLVASMLTAVGTAIAALFSPIATIAAAIGFSTYSLLKFTSVGRAVVDYLSKVFGDLLGDATEALGGIRDAISTGDWKVAAQILWTFLKIEFTKGVNQLKVLWAELKFAVIDIVSGMASDVQTVWSYMLEGLSKGWEGVKFAAGRFLDWMGNAFKATVSFVADLFQDLFMTTAKKQLAVELKRIDEAERSGKITHEQAEARRAGERQFAANYDDRARAGRDLDRERQYQDRKRAADDAYNKAQAGISSDAEASRKKIEEERAKAQREREEELKKKIGEATDPKEIEELKKQLHDMVQEARFKAHPEFGTPKFIANDASNALDEAMKRSTSGTFNKTALFGFGAGGTLDKIEKNTRETANAVKKFSIGGQAPAGGIDLNGRWS